MRAAHLCSGLLAPMLSFDPAVQDCGEVPLIGGWVEVDRWLQNFCSGALACHRSSSEHEGLCFHGKNFVSLNDLTGPSLN